MHTLYSLDVILILGSHKHSITDNTFCVCACVHMQGEVGSLAYLQLIITLKIWFLYSKWI